MYKDKQAGTITAKNFSDFISSKRLDHKDCEYEIRFDSIKINEIIQPMQKLFEAEKILNNNDSGSDSDSDNDEAIKIEFKLNEIV